MSLSACVLALALGTAYGLPAEPISVSGPLPALSSSLFTIQEGTPAPPAAPARETEVKVTTTERWFVDPVWIGLGVVAVIALVLIIALVSRSGSETSTTIIKD